MFLSGILSKHMLYAHFSDKRGQNKDWSGVREWKIMEREPSKLLHTEGSPVCRGSWRDSASKCHLPITSLGRDTPLKAAGFKSSVALGGNGIKGWTINLAYSQVTGHLGARILMGPFLLFLLLGADVIHGLSFSASLLILLRFLCFCFLTALKSKVLNYFMEWAQWIM